MPEVLPTWYRLFVALLLPEDTKDRIEAAQTELRRAVPHGEVGWTRSVQFHLTLKFLGDVEPSRVQALAAALREVAAGFGPLRLIADGIGFFPNSRSPRVVWAGLRDRDHQLAPLQSGMEDACRAFTRESGAGPFTGHVTLGRIKRLTRPETEALARAAAALGRAVFGEWTADRIELMRSELLPAGGRHSSVASIPLSH